MYLALIRGMAVKILWSAHISPLKLTTSNHCQRSWNTNVNIPGNPLYMKLHYYKQIMPLGSTFCKTKTVLAKDFWLGPLSTDFYSFSFVSKAFFNGTSANFSVGTNSMKICNIFLLVILHYIISQ